METICDYCNLCGIVSDKIEIFITLDCKCCNDKTINICYNCSIICKNSPTSIFEKCKEKYPIIFKYIDSIKNNLRISYLICL